MTTLIVNNHIENQRPLFRGSIVGHEPALNCNRVTGHMLLWDDYFKVPKPLFGPKHFRRRFRMAKHVFNRIREGVVEYDDYFRCKKDALGNIGFSYYQKCTAAIRILAYGVPGDLIDDYVRMSESMCLASLYRFCKAVVAMFGPEYLTVPNEAEHGAQRRCGR